MYEAGITSRASFFLFLSHRYSRCCLQQLLIVTSLRPLQSGLRTLLEYLVLVTYEPVLSLYTPGVYLLDSSQYDLLVRYCPVWSAYVCLLECSIGKAQVCSGCTAEALAG